MNDDLEPIPVERRGSTGPSDAGAPPSTAGGALRRRRRIAAGVAAAAAVSVGWQIFDHERSGPRVGREAGEARSPGDARPGAPYPAERAIPPLPSTADRRLTRRAAGSGQVATLVLEDRSGQAVWELPRLGDWDPLPTAWSPDGRRFLFSASAGRETVTRVAMLPEGRDVAAPGALTWIGDDELLVWLDGRLGRLDIVSGALVQGERLIEYVSAQAGTRGGAALVIIPGLPAGAPAGAQPPPPFVRFVDSSLHTRDTPAPAGTVDCWDPTWTQDRLALTIACRRADPPPELYEIDVGTLRWTHLPEALVGRDEQPLFFWSPATG